MRTLAKGENLALPGDRAVLIASGGALRVVAVDDADRAMGPALEPGGALAGIARCAADRVELDVAAAPPQLQRLLIVIAVPARGGPLAAAPPAQLTLIDADHAIAQYTHAAIAQERALILAEVYRRAGQWKLRAVGQGYRGGLPELLAIHGAAPQDVAPASAEYLDGDVDPQRRAAAPPMPAAGSMPAAPPMPAAGSAPADPSLAAERQMRVLAGVFEDAARSTAGYRSAVEFADRRRERELAALLDDPRRRAADDPARAEVTARYDELVMQATADHHRSFAALRQEMTELLPHLAAPFAPWDSAAWAQPPVDAPGLGIRIGEVLLPDAPELSVPLTLPFPSFRAIWLDGDDDAVAAMARGLLLRMVAASGPGEIRVRSAGTGEEAAVLRGADGTGLPLTSLTIGAADVGAGEQHDGASAVAQLAHRADLLEMARTAGADALPPNLHAGHVVLLWNGQPELDSAGSNALRALMHPTARVSIVLLGAQAGAAADAVDALRLVAGQDAALTDGWVGLSWTFRPDPGPTDAQLARTRLLA